MKEPNKGPNKWLALINIPIQMGVIIYLFHLLGEWLDGKYNLSDGLANKICTLIGVGLALYQVIRQVNQLNRK
ncbi:AtpZ/AtpI family protein [Myroides injenensis]|uniref:AtpZ/AtpI family protein n=1 Tax=Myroides injenensis TaxID=1183151 RepID=UPI00226FCA1E|nr:AtpZ/AtpI family protein [Myroides injenensis]